MRSLIFLLASASLTTAAAAEEPKPDTGKPQGEQKVCKRIQKTGSRLPSQQVCKTQREWQAESDASVNAARIRSKSGN